MRLSAGAGGVAGFDGALDLLMQLEGGPTSGPSYPLGLDESANVEAVDRHPVDAAFHDGETREIDVGELGARKAYVGEGCLLHVHVDKDSTFERDILEASVGE